MIFKDFYFTEALSNNLMHLQRYLNMSDVDKAINRAFNNSCLINAYIEKENYHSKIKGFDKMDEIEKVEALQKKDMKTLIDFGAFVEGEREYYDSQEMEFYDVVSDLGFVRNKWLIHFSTHAYDIVKDQTFKVGIPYEDYQLLGLTTMFKDIAKTGGFNFAFELKDVEKYYSDRGTPKYGTEAVIFKGDGIKVFHSGDNEPQCVFDGKSTYGPLIHVEYEDETGVWVIKSAKTNKVIYKNESIEKIVNWADLNYAQYINHLGKR